MDYRKFLNILEGGQGIPIFEPFPTRKIVTQLIWRGGDELWSTAKRRAETLIEFHRRIVSDVVPIEPCKDSGVFEAELPEGMKFVVISDDPEELESAARNDKVCALATGGQYVDTGKPLIYLSKGRGIKTLDKRFAGVYQREYSGGSDRVILGGIGSEFINCNPPMKIDDRIEALTKSGLRALGTGGFGEDIEYLGFISMLGKYNKLRG